MLHECVILVRNPDGEVYTISQYNELEERHITMIFPNMDDAVDYVEKSWWLTEQNYQIVELDEL